MELFGELIAETLYELELAGQLTSETIYYFEFSLKFICVLCNNSNYLDSTARWVSINKILRG